MTELGVSEFVEAASGTDGEVPPDVGARPEIECLERTRRWLEPSVRVFSSDADGNDMTLGTRFALELRSLGVCHFKVDLGGTMGSNPIESSDVSNAVERDAHGDLELGSGEVDSRHHLGCWVLDLEARVEFKEIENILCVAIEVCREELNIYSITIAKQLTFDSAGTDIANELRQSYCSAFHLLKGILLRDGDGGLLDDLLVTALNRTVPSEQGNGVAILVCKELDFQMAG